MTNELTHHGILGQKWGKRNGPPYPLDASEHSYSEKKAGWRNSIDKLKTEKHIDNSSGKSDDNKKHRGLTEKQKKAIKIGAVLAATALVAYGGYKVKKSGILNEYIVEGKSAVNQLWNNRKGDMILKEGTTFHTITSYEHPDMNSPFYASYKKSDQIRYKGFFATEKLMNIFGPRKAFDVTTVATKDMKIASREKAAKVFADLCKEDSEFRDDVTNNLLYVQNHAVSKRQKALAEKISPYMISHMNEKALMGKTYDAFNISLGRPKDSADTAYQKFYKKLTELGYSAIIDMNDRKYSGYKSKSPVIVFDISSITKQQVQRLSEESVAKNFRYAYLINNGKKYLAELGLGSGLAVGGGIGIAKYKKKNKEQPAKKVNRK